MIEPNRLTGGGVVSVAEAARLLRLSYQRTYTLLRRGESGDPTGLRGDWYDSQWGISLAEVGRLREYRDANPFITRRRVVTRKRGSAAKPATKRATGGAQ